MVLKEKKRNRNRNAKCGDSSNGINRGEKGDASAATATALEKELRSKSIKYLKDLLQRLDIRTNGMVEKDDLVHAIVQARMLTDLSFADLRNELEERHILLRGSQVGKKDLIRMLIESRVRDGDLRPAAKSGQHNPEFRGDSFSSFEGSTITNTDVNQGKLAPKASTGSRRQAASETEGESDSDDDSSSSDDTDSSLSSDGSTAITNVDNIKEERESKASIDVDSHSDDESSSSEEISQEECVPKANTSQQQEDSGIYNRDSDNDYEPSPSLSGSVTVNTNVYITEQEREPEASFGQQQVAFGEGSSSDFSPDKSRGKNPDVSKKERKPSPLAPKLHKMKREKSVQFADINESQIYEIKPLREMSDEEIGSQWFLKDEYAEFKNENEVTTFLMDGDQPIPNELETRGLEGVTIEGAWEQYEARRKGLIAVLDEQEQKKSQSCYALSNRIAMVYSEVCSSSAAKARQYAKDDEKLAFSLLKSIMPSRMRRRRKSKLNCGSYEPNNNVSDESMDPFNEPIANNESTTEQQPRATTSSKSTSESISQEEVQLETHPDSNNAVTHTESTPFDKDKKMVADMYHEKLHDILDDQFGLGDVAQVPENEALDLGMQKEKIRFQCTSPRKKRGQVGKVDSSKMLGRQASLNLIKEVLNEEMEKEIQNLGLEKQSGSSAKASLEGTWIEKKRGRMDRGDSSRMFGKQGCSPTFV